MLLQIGLGILLAAVVALAAWKIGSLSPSGAIAALITGGLVFGLGGLPWAVLLLAFFISSSLLSRMFAPRKRDVGEKFAKGSRRDWGQVLANGGVGAFLAVIYGLYPEQAWAWTGFVGAMAAVNADTWATEIGVLSRDAPRLITNGRVVERGTSGGVSVLGILASMGGAALIGGLAALADPGRGWVILAASAAGGLAGSLFDSFLGATVQAIYFCPACRKETERHPLHHCNTPTLHVRGWGWMNNDWVNFICSLVGAAVTAALLLL